MEVSDVRRLKALEDENARLKKLLAEQILDNAILKDVAAKKWWRPMRIREGKQLAAARHAARAACFFVSSIFSALRNLFVTPDAPLSPLTSSHPRNGALESCDSPPASQFG